MSESEATQLYRVENPNIPANPDGVVSHGDLVGQWFSPNLDTAINQLRLKKVTQSFGPESQPIDGARLVIAHVPPEGLEELHVSRHKTASTMDVEGDNYIIPRDGSIPTDVVELDDVIGDLGGRIGNFRFFTEARKRIIERLGQLSSSEAQGREPEPPEILIDHKILYHGSATSGIKELDAAEEDTVGYGVYLVDNPQDASGYAKRSTEEKRGKPFGSHVGSPIVYAVEVDKAKLVNLDNPEKLKEIMNGYASVIRQALLSTPDMDWKQQGAIHRALEQIERGVRTAAVKHVTQTNGRRFTAYLQELGYDGLKTGEGGERPYVGDHDTYVIFDPAKVKTLSEKPV